MLYIYSKTWPGSRPYATLKRCVSPPAPRRRQGRSPPSSRPSPGPAWCCPAGSPNGAPAAVTATAPAAPTRPGCTARTGSGPARSPPRPSAAGSAPTSSTTTRPGSTTTGGCASCSPGSRPSAPPPSTPTRAGSAPPRQPRPIPPHNSAGTARLTCGRHRDHAANAQLTPKREDLSRTRVYLDGREYGWFAWPEQAEAAARELREAGHDAETGMVSICKKLKPEEQRQRTMDGGIYR